MDRHQDHPTLGVEERNWIDGRFAGRVGSFLEIGAFDGTCDSLTKGLVAGGWRGLQVEPNPTAFLRLLEANGRNSQICLLNAAVTASGGVSMFYSGINNEQVSTASCLFAQSQVSEGVHYDQFYTHCISVRDLLAWAGLAWTFLTIDTEGCDSDILREFPLSRMTETEVICCECNPNNRKAIKRKLLPWYRIALTTDINIIAVRK